MINTIKHLCYALKIDESELNFMISNIDNFYYEKIEHKINPDKSPKLDKHGNPKKRILHPSINRLKVIQKRIKAFLIETIEMPDYAYGGIKGKDNIKNARKHQGKKFNFTTDLKDFYPSIRNSQVFLMFRINNFSPTAARVLTKLTTYKGKVPQGAPTSSIIANLVFITTGKKLQEFAKENIITFTSFVDDLTFSSPFDFKGKSQEIINILVEDGFRISHSKTNYKTKNPKVTGVIVKNNNLSTTNDLKSKIQQATQDSNESKLKGLKIYESRIRKA